MRTSTIRKHLDTFKIASERKTTINHAFASALAPADIFDKDRVAHAMEVLGQDPSGDLHCVYCFADAETWDHVVGLVKDGNLRGYGHQLGNLVPCCKNCNSSKGGKTFKAYLWDQNLETSIRDERIDLIRKYVDEFAVEIDLDLLNRESPEQHDRYQNLKAEIIDLMEMADVIAADLREIHRRAT